MYWENNFLTVQFIYDFYQMTVMAEVFSSLSAETNEFTSAYKQIDKCKSHDLGGQLTDPANKRFLQCLFF